MEKLVYSVPEMAQALGIGQNVAYALVAREDFPSVKIGNRRIVVPRAALDEWLARQSTGGAE